MAGVRFHVARLRSETHHPPDSYEPDISDAVRSEPRGSLQPRQPGEDALLPFARTAPPDRGTASRQHPCCGWTASRTQGARVSATQVHRPDARAGETCGAERGEHVAS